VIKSFHVDYQTVKVNIQQPFLGKFENGKKGRLTGIPFLFPICMNYKSM
jgi:hypothetical protein